VRWLLIPLLAAVVTPGFHAAQAASGYDPGHEGLVLITVAVPERVEIAARLHLESITACVGSRRIPVPVHFTELDSRSLAGRSPRWGSFALEPAVLDSLLITWQGVDVRVEEAWTYPDASEAANTFAMGRRINAGEVVVVNLRWEPDAMPAAADDWRPHFEIEELVEPPPGARVYVSEEDRGVVAVYDRAAGRLVRALPAGGKPRDLVWDELRQRLYVTVAGRDELLAIDPTGRATIRRLPLSYGADSTRLILTQDGSRIAVLAPGRDMVFLFSAASLQEIAKIPVGQGPEALVEDPRTGRILVSCNRAGRIDVIDPGSARVVRRFEQMGSPSELLMLGSGQLAVGQDPGRRIELLDPATGAVQATVNACGPVDGLLELSRFERVLALSNFCSEITILRVGAGLELGGIPLDEVAGLPSLGPRGAEVFVPLPDSNRILVFSSDRAADQAMLDVGPTPWRVLVP